MNDIKNRITVQYIPENIELMFSWINEKSTKN